MQLLRMELERAPTALHGSICDTFGVKDLSESVHRFPGLTRFTGMAAAFHHYVRLKLPQ